MGDTNNDDFENQDDESGSSEQGTEDEQKDTDDAESKSGSSEQSGSAKDLSAMQSEKDKETARANKAVKELKAMKDATAKDADGSEVPPQVQEWIVAAQSSARDALFKANPKFEQHGISPDLITGNTPAEMKASAKTLGEFVTKLEGNVRDSVLEEHGLDPEPKGSSSGVGNDFKGMSTEEFDKLVTEALRG